MTRSAGAAERGVVLLDLGRSAEAERHFREALAGDPSNAQLKILLAQSLHAQERYAEARDAAREGLAADPGHVGGLLILSAALAGLRDFDAAVEANQRAQQVAPNLPQVHRQHGALLISADRSSEALGPLERARTLDPEDSLTVALIGAALLNVRRFHESEQAVAEALRLDPDNSEAHRIRGLLSLRQGGGRSAVDAHRTALRLDPTDPGYREDLAVAMKSRNPLYGLLLRFADWQAGLPSGARWLVLLAPYLATRILRPFIDHWWAQSLLLPLVLLVVLTWALEPVMNTVLLCSSYARNLLPRATKVATSAFLAYAVAAVTAVVVGLRAPSDSALLLALALGLWAMSVGQAHLVTGRRRKLTRSVHGAGAVLAVAATSTLALGVAAADPLILALLLSGVAMLWFTAVP